MSENERIAKLETRTDDMSKSIDAIFEKLELIPSMIDKKLDKFIDEFRRTLDRKDGLCQTRGEEIKKMQGEIRNLQSFDDKLKTTWKVVGMVIGVIFTLFNIGLTITLSLLF